MKRIYFDNAATTKTDRRVVEKMLPYLNNYYGNPSSVHYFGLETKAAIEEARETIAKFINADPSEIYFTSGGTEANNFILKGAAIQSFLDEGKNAILASAVEHHSVMEPLVELERENFKINYIQVLNDSRIDLENLKQKLTPFTSIVSVMHVNNETGAINNIEEISTLKENFNFILHTDAVQSLGKIPVDVKELGVDFLSASAHKFHGPKGIGFAYVKNQSPIKAFITGGAQERKRRGGTENVPAIIGLAEAIKILTSEMQEQREKVEKIYNRFNESLLTDFKHIRINRSSKKIPHILSITFPEEFYTGSAEEMIMFLDVHGIAASYGAACSSGTLSPSHVMLAMGMPEEDARGTLRFSFSHFNTPDEVDFCLKVIQKLHSKFHR